MIKVEHSACLAMGGNFDPCYFLTLNTVPSQMGPATNKRNAAMIQAFMAEILSVPSERGIVKFVPIAEENLAMNGNTVLGVIERQEKQGNGSAPNGIKSAMATDAARKSMSFSKTNPKLQDMKSNSTMTTESTASPSVTPPPPAAAAAAAAAPILTTPAAPIYDRPTTADNKNGRPSTAHGASMSIGGFDGLRMNGISTEQLTGKTARTPNGRPKTFDGGVPSSFSIQDSLKSQPLPQVPRQLSANLSQRPNLQQRPSQSQSRNSLPAISAPSLIKDSHVPLAPRPSVSVVSSTTTSNGKLKTSTATARLPAAETRARNTYLDNVSHLTKKGTPVEPNPTEDDDEDVPLAKNAAANTAKRRSTITATPKLPTALKPPPVPKDETRSVTSRLGKRKSFLKMFKRNSVPAWYDN